MCFIFWWVTVVFSQATNIFLQDVIGWVKTRKADASTDLPTRISHWIVFWLFYHKISNFNQSQSSKLYLHKYLINQTIMQMIEISCAAIYSLLRNSIFIDVLENIRDGRYWKKLSIDNINIVKRVTNSTS